MALAVQGLLGLVLIPAFAWAISANRRALTPGRLVRIVVATIAVQMLLAVLLLKVPQSRIFFEWIGHAVAALQRATEAGMQVVFGYLAGSPPPFTISDPRNSGFILAFRALPLILVMSALTRLLYHWGVLQRLVSAVAPLFQRAFGIGGPLGTVAAAKIFLGMIEAPLLVRPYLASMGRGALFAAMSVGMATVAGTVMALYALILEPVVPGAAGHVLAASLMNAPAALMLARLAMPDGFEGGPPTARIALDNPPKSSMDAIAQGTFDGLRLLAGVVAMLVVMLALVALANAILGSIGSMLGLNLSLQSLLGFVCAPLALAIGIPWSEAAVAGSLIGQKVVLNELLAYIDMAGLPADALSGRSRLIMTYALCGFANLGSLGIMIGGLTAMVPERRGEIVDLAPRAMLIGFLATLLSAAVVGVVIWQ